MNGDRLLWLLRRYAPEWAPRITVGLLLMLGVFWLAVLVPLQEQVDAAELRERSERDGMLRRADVNQAGSPQERLTRFYAFFENADGLSSRLAQLHSVAKANGLELHRAEYRMLAPPEQKLARYQIILPVEGSYRSIRQFASQALEEIPALALSQIKFQRRRISESSPEAQIIFTLYIRP